ncbi:ANTAR domain-containing protein [Mycolicibacterium sp. S2-37]|nr:ANTAR domain-containing protein [Mycolicibacterium sp. S2-37]
MAPPRDSGDRSSRRDIDLAIGALIGIRRCSEREAFDAIVDAVHATGIGLGEVSHALVALVSGATEATDSPAIRHWCAVVSPLTCRGVGGP